jgi:hypothetical protein
LADGRVEKNVKTFVPGCATTAITSVLSKLCVNSDRLLALGYINVTKVHRRRALCELGKLMQNIGMPVQVGVDIDAHRLNLAFKLSDSGKSLNKMLLRLFDFLSVTHKYVLPSKVKKMNRHGFDVETP